MKNKQTTTEEQTLVLFKRSDALRRLGPNRSRLAKCGHIVHARMVHMNSEVMDVLCSHLNPVLKQATIKHYGGQMIPVFVIQGDNIIARVSKLVGTAVNPEFCTPDSIRYQMWAEFGCRVEALLDGSIYYDNFVHCTRTAVEALQQIPVLINPNVISFPI